MAIVRLVINETSQYVDLSADTQVSVNSGNLVFANDVKIGDYVVEGKVTNIAHFED